MTNNALVLKKVIEFQTMWLRHVAKIKEILGSNHRMNVRMIAKMLGLTISIAHQLVTEEFKFEKSVQAGSNISFNVTQFLEKHSIAMCPNQHTDLICYRRTFFFSSISLVKIQL